MTLSNYGVRNESKNTYYLEGCCGSNYENKYPSDIVSSIAADAILLPDFVTQLNNGGAAWAQDTNNYNAGYPILNDIDYSVYIAYRYPQKTAYTIVEAVRRYTSKEELGIIAKRLEEILQNNVGADEVMRLLVELFGTNDLTDIREGIEYLVDCSDERASYLALMTDGMYCAYNYQQYVENNKLVADELTLASLFIGGEINDYINLAHCKMKLQ